MEWRGMPVGRKLRGPDDSLRGNNDRAGGAVPRGEAPLRWRQQHYPWRAHALPTVRRPCAGECEQWAGGAVELDTKV
jgi:hypothetical protein